MMSSSPGVLAEHYGALNPSPTAHSVAPTVLRQRRSALTAARNYMACAIDVLALDLEILNWQEQSEGNNVPAIIDELPDLLATGWDSRTWTFSVDISDLIAAVTHTDRLLDLHEEMVASELEDPDIAHSLFVRMKARRNALVHRTNQLEKEIEQIQKLLLQQYAAGIASTDDWLA
jgi:hypothetical protein